ncbi:MAG: response regulator transcription factor [Chloroflexi bacterium]|nr:response regulator transcription factor [Chloroflexota bacterium]
MVHLLIVVPDREAEELARDLGQHGLSTSTAQDPEIACDKLEHRAYELVLLDAEAFPPSHQGTKRLLSFTREKGITVLALLAVATVGQEITQDASFDDFAVRPVPTPELVARVQRLARQRGARGAGQTIRIGDLAIDPERYEVTVAGRPVDLTYREYQLLLFLANNPERVFSRETLLDRVWGYDYFGGTRTVDVHIRRLRSKLEDASHLFIETLRNIGYRFRASSGPGG